MVFAPSLRHRHVLRQLDNDPLGVPTAEGISTGALTAGTASGTALAFDTSAVNNGVTQGPAATLTFSVPKTTSTTDAPSQSESDTASSSSSSSNQIPIGTVIGACVGAFIGAIILISFGIWMYRRSDAKHRRRSPTRSARKSDQWKRLGDNEDKWDGMPKTREISGGVSVAPADPPAEPMEKLTMFKKSPSIRTNTTQAHTEEVLSNTYNFDHPFAQYHPNLAQQLASTHEAEEPTVKPFTNRAEAVPSWDGDASMQGSFLSLRSNRLSGTMSPTFDMAIPTPPLTSSELHRWESAEVINFEGQSAEIVDPSNENSNNPFLHHTEIRRKSVNNPFFGAQPDTRRASVSKGSRSRGITPGLVTTPPSDDINPFSDDAGQYSKSHAGVDSMASNASNDRAIQSLLAALEVRPEDMPRVASMQPSLLSAYTEEDVTDAFPVPPGTHSTAFNANSSS
ncbi:hypothetical protein D9758_003781 [Tetrapyrgos nigripes]|uniref:Uncharacterized protein n=1 Tax=Tetrapyrgos nigripes TaxID=182062 RepID=A0A8H5GMG2_9AGAR|nr:hypothetical protein D9758_003781 [Tetrapyrgos nigripes]